MNAITTLRTIHTKWNKSNNFCYLVCVLILLYSPLVIPENLAGIYHGHWESHFFPFEGRINAYVTTDNEYISAIFTISGNPIFSKGTLTGNIKSNEGKILITISNKYLNITVEKNSTIFVGTYKCKLVICLGDKGAIIISK